MGRRGEVLWREEPNGRRLTAGSNTERRELERKLGLGLSNRWIKVVTLSHSANVRRP